LEVHRGKVRHQNKHVSRGTYTPSLLLFNLLYVTFTMVLVHNEPRILIWHRVGLENNVRDILVRKSLQNLQYLELLERLRLCF